MTHHHDTSLLLIWYTVKEHMRGEVLSFGAWTSEQRVSWGLKWHSFWYIPYVRHDCTSSMTVVVSINVSTIAVGGSSCQRPQIDLYKYMLMKQVLTIWSIRSIPYLTRRTRTDITFSLFNRALQNFALSSGPQLHTIWYKHKDFRYQGHDWMYTSIWILYLVSWNLIAKFVMHLDLFWYLN